MRLKFISICILISNFVISSSFECGQVKVGKPLSIGSEYASRGQLPWLVPLFTVEKDKFFCSSTLISKRHLLTASHCIQDKSVQQPKQPNEIYALIGKYNLAIHDESDVIKAFIKSIQMHPDWNIRTSSFDADVSVLTLKNEISFNNFIQPACLPEITSNVYNTKGTVAGYGLSLESGNNHENRPKFLEINSVTQEECLFSNEIYNKISSRRSFCAGEKGKSACRGDSGGGFYVKSTNKYTIFGIVSAAPFVDCVENVYVIFTNVPKFIVWIKDIMDKRIDDDEVTVQGRTASLECEIKHKSDDNSYECFNNKIKSTQQNTLISSITGSLNDQNVSKLRTVNIVSAEVTYIPDFTAVNRKFPKFDQLYIVLSGLKFVERKQLAKMPQLTLLNFFGNEIEFLPEDAFDDLVNLKILAFVQNKIKVLPPKLLWNLPKLVELWAYENPYEVIPRRFFKNNKEVVKLWMGYNKIKKIEVNFKALPKLDVLDLRENVCINLQTCISCGAENFNDIQEKIDRDCNQDAIQWVSLQEA